ncbi:glycoside hydrolase family 25 protein [Clostridium frigidicarnis]|uniref:Lyzozyme M1 (1,4-beta-N-acetylmuramidase), GH25 family n=1 Tax=Clostridium frigidicarnis TaxID=84698 RepID=A0A1I0YS31_9CLOT|nr:glycoside hydrolase family 25 protein [Clostridium frigidicarnis]SFB15250.1 Lyzozyme M1 (1,4-beta-N-acetylmuramidase), GH25 family [Clostridium frigidicarnis]
MQDRNPKSLFGADINEFSQGVDFRTLATKLDFLYLRSSGSGSGAFRVDKKFLEFASGARGFGIPVGAYHYAFPYSDLTTADSQCDDFIDILQQGFGTENFGDLFPVLDVEAPVEKTISTKTLLSWVERFKKRFEKRTRRRLMIYTGIFFIQLYDDFLYPGRGHILSNMPLWIALYPEIKGNPPYPPNAGGWTRWTIWQYTEKGKVDGIESLTDLNWGPNSIDYLVQPRNVLGLKAYRVKNKIYVSWTPNKDVDLSGYNLYLNGLYAGTVGKKVSNFVIDVNKFTIPKDLDYEVQIEAFDAVGEFSPSRSIVTLPRNDKVRSSDESGIYYAYPDIIMNAK